MTAALARAPLDFSRDIWTVSRLTSEVGAVLTGSFPLLWVQGELSNLAQPASGHLYFTLKDLAAQVRCALFRPKRRLLAFTPANGQQVLLRARVGLYEPRGDFQLICEHMEPAGEGALRLELDQRQRRLAAEGLFDAGLKRPLPPFPRQVGLITSASGAAVHDLLTVLGRRFPLLPVLIYPAQVQGDGAVATLLAALALANRRADCDLLILARGGGSLEDLMAFNDEALARAIRASSIPVVTGIGHEVDQSIADLVADRRAATPSAAAELITPNVNELHARLHGLHARGQGAITRRLEQDRRRLAGTLRHLTLLHPAARLQQQAQRLDDLERQLQRGAMAALVRQRDRLERVARRLTTASPATRLQALDTRITGLDRRLGQATRVQLSRSRERLSHAIGRLNALSPLAILTRGYAVVTTLPTGAILRDAATAPPGTRLAIRLQRGGLIAVVAKAAISEEGDE